MFSIYKLRDDQVIDFAAQELKKYLLMMMPEETPITIHSDSKAADGFRLGLLEDFGIDPGDIDPLLDDIVHVDTTENGGILAGSNMRSILFAVYRFLRLNGCRFLYPGADGERIPVKKITPQKYHKLADHRFRGRTIEGRPSLEHVLASLDHYAKEEINAFGCYRVAVYHHYYYEHRHNSANMEPEFFDDELSHTQWRALYEAEAQKRGMLLLSGEHEMIAVALGLKESDRFLYKEGKKEVPPEIFPYLAMMNGERKLKKNDINFTNLCMSNPEVRERMAQAAVSEIERRPQLNLFGCMVADTSNNHCECEECQKKIPSDWYIMVLNRIDEILTEKGISTRLLFSFYVDMIFAPETERLNNPSRFIFQYCPISRTYTKSLQPDSVYPEPIKYVRNKWEAPKSQEMLISLFRKWQEIFHGPCSAFEYHYWVHQFRDPGHMAISRRVYEDVRSYEFLGMSGCMQDGSNKSYWPNGFHTHIFDEAMINRDCDFTAELNDFYQNQYGKDWEVARDYLQAITDAFDHKYMCGEKSSDPKMGTHYNPAHAESLAKVADITEKLLAFAPQAEIAHRVEYQGWKLLRYHAQYCAGLAKVMTVKCLGDTPKALEMLSQFHAEFGKNEALLDRWLDLELAYESITAIVKKMPKVEF